ncbi:MAG: MFS transporter [Candidatus Gracilibacteria bacterium]
MLSKKSSLSIILLTVLLDIIGFGLIIPSLPFIIRGFGLGEHWVGITFATFSIGMFLGGIVFGRLSDVYGRKRILMVTSFLNMLGYILFAFAGNIWFFMFARFLSGLGGAGMAIGQAYISDISTSKDRTKNLGLTGAMFGIGFTIGPVLGGLFGNGSHFLLGIASALVIFVNLLIIVFSLSEVTNKHLEVDEESTSPLDFYHHQKQIYTLFSLTLLLSLGFSAMQTTFPLLLADRFSFHEKEIGYLFGFIGIIAIIYQGFLIKYIRNILDEKGMILFGFSALILSFALFAFNPYVWGISIIALFPLGQGSINPAVGSLHAHYAGKEVGKALGTNASMMSLGNIIGPFLAGYLYVVWSGAPYIASSIFFLIALGLVFFGLRNVARKG